MSAWLGYCAYTNGVDYWNTWYSGDQSKNSGGGWYSVNGIQDAMKVVNCGGTKFNQSIFNGDSAYASLQGDGIGYTPGTCPNSATASGYEHSSSQNFEWQWGLSS